eukprot:TRINITY_DN19572_c0_g3_i1.p1 TRINITY_DN19572_c0_g3~~TRINITY_DN19572_c0_g3_i1.p1  ORF type:complete len:381 (+),score=69.08 TRINITY_DN19572_c0_g3_i1:136-1278(+)
MPRKACPSLPDSPGRSRQSTEGGRTQRTESQWAETKRSLCEPWRQHATPKRERVQVGRALSKEQSVKEARQPELERSWDPVRHVRPQEESRRSASVERRKEYDRVRASAARAAAQQQRIVRWATYVSAPRGAPRTRSGGSTPRRGQPVAVPAGWEDLADLAGSGMWVRQDTVPQGTATTPRCRRADPPVAAAGRKVPLSKLLSRSTSAGPRARSQPGSERRSRPASLGFEETLLQELGVSLGRGYQRTARPAYFSRATHDDIKYSRQLSPSPSPSRPASRTGTPRALAAASPSPARGSLRRSASADASGRGAAQPCLLTADGQRGDHLYRSVTTCPSVQGFRKRRHLTHDLSRGIRARPEDLAGHLLARDGAPGRGVRGM